MEMSANSVSTTVTTTPATSVPPRGKLASLYYMADTTDYMLIFTGCVLKLAFGATQGFVIVIFGDFFDVPTDKFRHTGRVGAGAEDERPSSAPSHLLAALGGSALPGNEAQPLGGCSLRFNPPRFEEAGVFFMRMMAFLGAPDLSPDPSGGCGRGCGRG